jgi:polysaccharide biosynthesis protein PslH
LFKILQITNKAPAPPDDGSSIAVYNMCMGLIENGAEVHLLAINTKKHFKPIANADSNFVKKSNYQVIEHDTDVNVFGAVFNLFSSQSYFVSRFYFKEFEKQIIKKLNATKFDIIQIEGVFMGVYLDVIRKYSTAKVVLRAHNVEFLIWERHLKSEYSLFRKKYLTLQTARLKNYEIGILNKVDAVVSITEVDKTIFSELTNKPVSVCITGLNLASYRRNGETITRSKSVFYFASMDWMPNQQAVDWFLANCWEKIAAEVPDATFVVAGKNMPERYRKINARNVRIVPEVNDGKEFYHQHDILVVPLLSGSGLRIKIIEGMAYGKAIVSTSVGAEGIPIENGKNILIADKADDFANAVIKVLKDQELKARLEREALLLSEREFDNKCVVSELIGFYKALYV